MTVAGAHALRAISALIKKPPLLDLSVDQIDLMTGDQASEWTQIVSLLLWANDGGGTHAFAEYCAWPEEAGFAQVRSLSDRWLAAVRCE